jgi:hypothetical protein
MTRHHRAAGLRSAAALLAATALLAVGGCGGDAGAARPSSGKAKDAATSTPAGKPASQRNGY